MLRKPYEYRNNILNVYFRFGQFFIKQLTVELLDRRLTLVQQPRHRLAQLESACHRQFPNFSERQIRLKIRGQLKLYRRNLKKAEERKAANATSITPAGNKPAAIQADPHLGPAYSTRPQRYTANNNNNNNISNNNSNNVQTFFPKSDSYIASNPMAVVLAQKALMSERRQAAAAELIRQNQEKMMGGNGNYATPNWQSIGTSGGSICIPMFPKLPELRPVSFSSNYYRSAFLQSQ